MRDQGNAEESRAPDATAGATAGDEPDLTLGEVRDRAASGAAMLGARGALVMAVGVGVNIFLARRLGPEEFGLVALGTTMVILGQFLSAGLGAALIRREDRPRSEELASAMGFQLLGAVSLAALAAVVGAGFGRDGLLIAVMVLAIPVSVLRMPASVLLERRLSYGVIATVDVAEALVFYAWAVGTVLAGAGVWGFATAVLARAVFGTILMLRLGPAGWMRPRLAWSLTRPIIRFGLSYQAATAGGVARDQGLNIGIAAVAGINALGIWGLANRILQVPLLAMRSLLRVSYPAMSRFVGGGGDPAAAIERGIGMLAMGTAFLLIFIVGAAPAGLPPLVGEVWDDVPKILVVAALGLMVSIPIGTASIGYLFAAGRAGIVALAAALEAVAVVAVTLPLLPSLGVESVGIGWVAIGLIDLIVLGRAAGRATGARVFRSLALPLLVALAAGGVAVLASYSGEPALWRAVAAAGLGVGLAAAGFYLLSRDLLRQTVGMAVSGVRGVTFR